MHIVLIEPEIPPNTGNVARLCAATGFPLHLVGRLGFKITDKHLKRAGLDYWQYVEMHRHRSLDEFLSCIPESRLFFFSRHAERSYLKARFSDDVYLIFGSETRGLPGWLFDRFSGQFWKIPILHPEVRSLNLASAVAIVTYEALRQTGRI